MNGYNTGFGEQQQDSGPPQSELEKAMKKLVNVDRIDEPAEQEIKLTMMKKEEEAKKAKSGKSKGIAPVATGMVGSNATLEHIKAVKPVSLKQNC